MSIIGKITGLFTTDTTQWTKGIDNASKDVDRIENRFGSFIENLKSKLGKRSGLGEAAEIAIGRGAVGGLTEAAKAADEFVKKIGEISAAWKSGDASAGDMVETIAGGLPVVGQYWQLGRDIHTTITGEKQDIEESLAIYKDQCEALERKNKLIKQSLEYQDKLKDGILKAQQELELSWTPEGKGRDIKKTQFETSNKLESLDKDFAKNSGKGEIDATQKQIDGLRKKGDDRSIREAENLTATLKDLQKNYTSAFQLYQEERSAIANVGAQKILEINAKADQKEAETKNEIFQKQLEAQTKQQEEKNRTIEEMQKKMAEEGKKLMEQSDPSIALKDKIENLKALLDSGSIDQKTFDAQAGKAKASFVDAAGGKEEEYRSAPTEIRRHADIVTGPPKIDYPKRDAAAKDADGIAGKAAGGKKSVPDLLQKILDKTGSGEVTVNF